VQQLDGDLRATPPLLKALNERAVLDVIRRLAPVSRAEVARQSGISKPTVSSALRALLDAGLVREAEQRGDGPSYGAVFFEPVPEAAIVLGIDIGARYLRAAIADLSGAIRARQDVELHGADAAGVLAVVDEVRASLLAASRLGEHLVDSAVVAMPGVVGPQDEIGLAGGVAGLGGEVFTHGLRERLPFDVRFENDVNLAALGEAWAGVAQGVDDFAVLHVGTGTGVGIVLGGELHRGRHGAAGEIDLAYAGLGLDIDPCAAALEAYAERVARNHVGPTALRAPYDTPAVFAAARAGDGLAAQVVGETARRIAANIVPIAAVADVSLVVLGGGIGANGDLLLGPVRETLQGWLPYPPTIDVSSLGESAILTGALAQAVRGALDNVFARRRSSR
jgi:predicted NBD/HSP70 family sugar kinase